MEKLLRPYRPEDCDEIIQLFRNTVHAVNAHDYSSEQLHAWAPEVIDRNKWAGTLGANFTVVMAYGTTIVGFGDIDASGYFDHLFVHKDFQGQGIAATIAKAIESHAGEKKLERITVAASITAKPFFEKRGYTVLKQQQVERNGQILINFLMECIL